jgi:uncharacterized protein YjbI with pentapeptide repeats
MLALMHRSEANMTSTNRPTTKPRWQEVYRTLQTEISYRWKIYLVVILGIGCGVWRYQSYNIEHWQSFLNNFEAEFYGMLITVAGIYYFDKRRDDRRDEERLKTELLWQIHSRSNDVAISALDRLRVNGWLDLIEKQNLREAKWAGADLREIDLSGANLELADLSGAHMASADLSGAIMELANLSSAIMELANLSGAHMRSTNLNGANMIRANLSGANMVSANLNGASMHRVNLSRANMVSANLNGANMINANLSSATMWNANLRGAKMGGANLSDADIWAAHFYKQTQLPDETYWTAETDMTRFTNPDHPQFWRSDIPTSLTYQGKESEA